jgi:hypothetical protein
MGDEGAAVYNCLLCDSYALLILGILPDRKLARGTKGQSAYEDALEEFQLARAADKKLLLLACPTCNALAHKYETDQVAQGEFLRQGMAVLTPCVLVPFEDGQPPPVYRDENARGSRDGKPRWRTVSRRRTRGVGTGQDSHGAAAQTQLTTFRHRRVTDGATGGRGDAGGCAPGLRVRRSGHRDVRG